MSRYRPATVRCTTCGVTITGRMEIATGILYASRSPRVQEEEPGLCFTCAPGKARERMDANPEPTPEPR